MFLREKDKVRERNLLLNLLSEFGFSSIKDFQKAQGLTQDGVFGNRSYDALYSFILKPKAVDFEGGYYKIETPKNAIVWHHSSGWDNSRGMFSWWLRDGRKHVATSIGIEDDGTLYRGFDEKYWGHHIGCKNKHFAEFGLPNINNQLNRQTIAVEVCSAGALNDNGKSWFDYQVPEDRIIELDYKGSKLYETITPEECRTLKYWTLLNGLRYSIPLYYREFEMWNVSKDALAGVGGLYTHNSFRFDKSDISPQPLVIETAKALADYYK